MRLGEIVLADDAPGVDLQRHIHAVTGPPVAWRARRRRSPGSPRGPWPEWLSSCRLLGSRAEFLIALYHRTQAGG
jgi:hypothetical protein